CGRRRVFSAMRRSLARHAIAFTSASVGLRKVSRSVSRTQALASRNVGVGMSCSMSGSIDKRCSRGACLDCETGVHFCETHAKKRGGRLSRLPLEPSRALPVHQDPADSFHVHRLFGRSFRHRLYRHEPAAVAFVAKLDTTFDLCEPVMISPHADIKAGMPGRAALPRNDVAGNHVLAAKRLDAKALACRITSVA